MSQFESNKEENIISNRIKSKNNTILQNEEGRNQKPKQPLDAIDTSPFHEGNFIDKLSDMYREHRATGLEYFGKNNKPVNIGIGIALVILAIIILVLSIRTVFKVVILIVIILVILVLLKKIKK